MTRPLDRRTFLQASGVSLALPLLESMNPALAAAGNRPPKRLVFVCTSLGLHPPLLWPKTRGAYYESTPYLELLKDHRKDFTLFSGLAHENQTGRQPHDSEMTWLTAARKPGVSGFRNTISIDQVAASRLGYVTRFPSVTLGTVKPQSQSYTSGGVMIPAQTSPARVFAQMFLKGKPQQVQAEKRKLNDGRNLPIFLAGGGFKHGQYIAHDEKKNTPLCDLFVTMLNTVGLETESFGQSRGSLTW